jgi:hypothetical protein
MDTAPQTPDSDAEGSSGDDLDLGAAAGLLLDDGKTDAAALLVEAHLHAEYVDTGFPIFGGENTAINIFNVVLEVPRFLVQRFTDKIESEIHAALHEVMEPQGIHVASLRVRGTVEQAAPNWRERVLARLSPDPVNQAVVGPPMERPIIEDRCAFRSCEELQVYRAFKRARDRRPDDDTLGIAPNPALVIQHGHTWEPDLVITYRGHVGVVQVDGPHHHGRFAAEVSRDRILRHSGVAEIDHFTVEDTESDEDLDILVERFLKRLGGQ